MWYFADSDVYIPSRVAQLLCSTPMKNSRYKSGVEISCRSPRRRSRTRHVVLRLGESDTIKYNIMFSIISGLVHYNNNTSPLQL